MAATSATGTVPIRRTSTPSRAASSSRGSTATSPPRAGWPCWCSSPTASPSPSPTAAGPPCSTAAGAPLRAASSRGRSRASSARRPPPSAPASAGAASRAGPRGARGSWGSAAPPAAPWPCWMDAETVRRNLERVRERIGPDVEVLAATKYVEAADLPALAEAGIELVGENRAQDLLAKQEEHGDLFTWDFIGALQSRKLKDISPNVRLIHSIASESALRRLEQHPAKEVLIQVNVAGGESQEGVDPAAIGD